jgi:transketolase
MTKTIKENAVRAGGPSLDELCVNAIRFLSVDAVEKAKSGHPGTPMEAAPAAYALWTRFLRHSPANPQWPNRDRFILSAGHASMLLYSLLHLTGYDVTLDDIKNFRQWKSRTPGHPEVGITPGVETTTGPLGQGFGNGVGMAIAERYLAARFNRPGFPLVDYLIYAFVSDGDVMEGVASEAASLAGHLQLGKLKYVYLDNHITIEGDTSLAFSEDVAKRFEAYGWQVVRVADANDLSALAKAFETVRGQTRQPSLIILRTHIAFGSPNKQDTAEAHGAPLGPEETVLTKKALGWPTEPAFYVPEEARAHFRQAVDRGRRLEEEWSALLDRYRAAHPDLAAAWDGLHDMSKGDWKKHLPVFPAGEKIATREASGKVINALAPHLPALIGGSGDLAPSNSTLIKDGGSFSAANPAGRNLHFGVREHAMGAALNGLALTRGIIPYGGTFLIFSDYMRPSIRLAALSDLGVIYVMTHDSVGLGEDGPTHQPVEQLAALRAIPNLVVIRPADAAETAAAWRAAIERRHGPTLLALTRQKVPALDRAKLAPADGLLRGGYVLSDARDFRVILIATGSEVHVALAAQAKLAEKGVAARVVSLPSWELFEQQSAAYKDEVLPPGVRARVVVEAGCSLGWHRYAGPGGRLVTLDRFGASAPGDVALQNLGFNPDNVVENALAALKF